MTNGNENRKSKIKEKSHRSGGIAALSLLISLFDRLGDLIYDALINGFFGRIFTSHSSLRNKFSNDFIPTHVGKSGRIRRFLRKVRKFFASSLESCVVLSLATTSINKLSSLPLQYYGNFGLFFGVYTIVVYCIRTFVSSLAAPSSSYLWIGIVTTVFSIPMVFSRISLAISIKNSVFGRALFKDALGLPDECFEGKSRFSRGKGNIMLLLGLLAGISTFVIHPLYIIITISALIVMALIAVSPEIGILLTIVALPFLSFFKYPSFVLAILITVTAFFYLIKLIRGKRTFKLEALDITILIFGILILLSSVYSAGGVQSAISATMSFILLIGYFLLVNLMRTEKWIKRCIVALVRSASIVAIIGVFEFAFGAESSAWLDQGFYGVVKTRVVSVFENPNMLSAFLVMIFPFLLAFNIKAKEKNAKILTRALLLIFIACIIFTWSRAAWIALIVGTLIFALICKRKAFRIFGAAILVVPILPIVIPTSIIQRFLSIANLADSSIAYRIYTWQGTLNAIKDYWFCGIGYGDSAFQAIYPSYSYSGIEATPHSHSLILQILLCMGIVGCIVFCIAMFLNLQKSFEFIKVTNNPSTSIYVIASAVSIISALIIGVFDYIWYNPRLFYLFWIIIAIGCAFIRMSDYEKARREEFQHY